MLSYFIAYICLSSEPKYNQACNQALNATVIQTHFRRDFEEIQDNLQKNIETELYERVNKQAFVTTLGVYQIYSTQTIVYNFQIKPIADSISGTVTNSSSIVNLTWAL